MTTGGRCNSRAYAPGGTCGTANNGCTVPPTAATTDPLEWTGHPQVHTVRVHRNSYGSKGGHATRLSFFSAAGEFAMGEGCKCTLCKCTLRA